MRATDEQIARVRACLRWFMHDDDRAAIRAVLSELSELRANLASYTDSSGEPPRLVREERDMLRKLVHEFRFWDMLDVAADGHYWKTTIDKALEGK